MNTNTDAGDGASNYNKQYYEANKERLLAGMKEYREANPETIKAAQDNWKRNNEGHTYEDPDGYVKYIGYKHPAANPCGITGHHRIVLWDKLNGQDVPCHWCGNEVSWSKTYPNDLDALVVDHVNLDKHDNSPENLVPSCQRCNMSRPGGRKPRKRLVTGDCDFEGCNREAKARSKDRTKVWCSGHWQQEHIGKELTPLRRYSGRTKVTATHKECTLCGEFKTHDAFYIRDGKPKGACKACEITRTREARAKRLALNIPCSVEDCVNPVDLVGMCFKHYQRERVARIAGGDVA